MVPGKLIPVPERLKKEYHPEDDDKMVERVVTLVENGQL